MSLHLAVRILMLTAPILGLTVSGCGKTRLAGPVIDPQRGPVVEVPNDSALLRFKFVKGQTLRYGLKLQVNTDGVTQVSEKLGAEIFQRCLGPEESAPGQDGFTKLNFTRHEMERFKKVRENGRDQPPITAVRDVEPIISDNVGYDPETNSNYYACDAQGKFGCRTRTKFHRVVYDSLIYLLPVLPENAVKAGDTWGHSIPVYAGSAYYAGQEGRPGGNEFDLNAAFKLEKLWQQGAERFAYFTWTASGTFDTQAYMDHFPPRFHDHQRDIHEVKAAGSATMNVTRGVLVAKSGQASIALTVLTKILRLRAAAEAPEWETADTRHVMNYDCQLLDEGRPAPGSP